MINVHHYDEMDRDPEKNLPRLLELWLLELRSPARRVARKRAAP